MVKSLPIKERVHKIIFETDTFGGKLFDAVLLVLIFLSVVIVALETVPSLNTAWIERFLYLEWIFTIIFTTEYILRIWSTKDSLKYVTSTYGIIDLVAIIPTYLSLFLAGAQYFMVIRALRLLRIFRIFKMARYLDSGEFIIKSVKASLSKISVFLFFIILMVCIFGSIIYIVEGPYNEAFDSIPRSVYWSIVTLTTVGYGDISPVTPWGQFLASLIMIMGYGVIAVPTGIVSSEMMKNRDEKDIDTRACSNCSEEGHDSDASYCKYCGHELSMPL